MLDMSKYRFKVIELLRTGLSDCPCEVAQHDNHPGQNGLEKIRMLFPRALLQCWQNKNESSEHVFMKLFPLCSLSASSTLEAGGGYDESIFSK